MTKTLLLLTNQHTNLASTSVDTRPGTILRISVPNKTTSLSIANDTIASVPLKQNQKYI